MQKVSPDKLPPQALEVEKTLLGSLLIDKEAINKVADLLRPEDFYQRGHQIIYQAIMSLFDKHEPLDLLSLANKLEEMGHLEDIGGMAYLTSLAGSVGTSAHILSYAKIVQRKKMLRDLIDAAHHIIGISANEESDVEDLLDEAEKKLFSVSQKSLTKNFLRLGNTLDDAMNRILNQGDGNIRGQKTYFAGLDDKLGGLQKSDLIVLAARPSVGKTAFAINIALNVAKDNIPVGIFSMEMSLDQIVDRLIAAQSGVSLWKLRTGKLGEELQETTRACEELKGLPLFIDDSPSPNILQMRTMARRLQAEHGLGLLVVDYLQLMSARRNYDSPVQQVTEISRGLKGLAKELNIPIIAVSQLSRAVEQRDGHRPKLSDLRDSGCLTGDTFIMRADTGEFATIKSLVERDKQTPIPVFSMDKNLKLSVQPLTKAFSSGKKEVYEMKLRSGRTIKASSNHPFYMINGWHVLEELKVGGHIAIPRTIKLIKPENSLSDEEVILLAHLLGDGCILPHQPYHYTSADMKNIRIVSLTAKKLFGINRVHSYNKIIPPQLFKQSNNKIALFLHHLWATDGNISWKNLKGRQPAAAIYYSSTSKTLINQIQHLLLRFGIQATIRPVQKGSYRPNYNIHIQGSQNQLEFLRNISCYGNRGKITPELICALKKITPNQNLDVIPKEVWKSFIAEAKIDANITWRGLSAQLQTQYNGSSLFGSGISRNRMANLAQVLRSLNLRNLAESDLYWDEVVSIIPLGLQEVYDATVGGNHNFIANDIIVHNSIEQDADLVMFIHREDKIKDRDKLNPDQINTAQLIIAKHRNGPTGEIDFKINPDSLRFLELDKIHGDLGAVNDGENYL